MTRAVLGVMMVAVAVGVTASPAQAFIWWTNSRTRTWSITTPVNA